MESLMDKIVPIAMSAVLAAAMTGQLPRFTHALRMAQLQLVKDSRPSTWGNPSIFASAHTRKPKVNRAPQKARIHELLDLMEN